MTGAQTTALALTAALVIGCGGAGANQIVQTRDVPSASGAPSVDRVTDLGDVVVPEAGALPSPDSDGVFTVGELIIVRGSNFGKQPTVNIGGRPAEVIARTGSGAIVTRIPPGVPTGAADVEVSHPSGRGARPIEIRRYGFVVQPGTSKVQIVTLDARGVASPAGELPATGAVAVAVAHNGQVALVAANAPDGPRLTVIAIGAGGGPVVVRTRDLELTTASRITVARDAPWAAVYGDAHVVLVDLEDARTPALHKPFAPAGVGAPITAAALSHDGAQLVALHAPQNWLIAVDLTDHMQPKPLSPLAVLPDERVPLVRDVAFSPSGEQVWIAAGDSRASIAAGLHDTRLVIAGRADIGYTVESIAAVAGAAAPLELAVAPRESVIGGTAIRSREKRAAIAIACVDRRALDSAPANLLTGGQLGQIVRTDLEGDARVVYAEPALITDLAISHDVSFWAAATVRAGDAGIELGITTAPIAGGEPAFVRLADTSADHLSAPASLALSP